MKTRTLLPLLIVLLLSLLACSDEVSTKNSTAPNTALLCETALPFTQLDVKGFTIRIFEPDDEKQPTVWQGPVCIMHKQSGKQCGFDLSLVKGVSPSRDKNYITVGVFSGSNAHDVRIRLDNCRIE